MSEVYERAFAKVNLHLEVLGKRPDGYHELETIMHEVELFDDLYLMPGGDGVRLEVSDPAVGVGEDNLAVKAVRALEKRLGRSFPCAIRLVKRIPAGGGLGGGSSDAGAVLRALDRAFGLGLPAETLEDVAATFGSDTSFFIRGGTAMCRGRGEIITPMAAPKPLHFVLVLPGIHVPTPLVFKSLRLTDSPRASYDLARNLSTGNVAGVVPLLFNRLEEPARREFPELDRLLSSLAPYGAIMSGSGSTLFFVCDSREDAEQKGREVRASCNTKTVVAASASR